VVVFLMGIFLAPIKYETAFASIPVTDIRIHEQNITLGVGESSNLTVTITPIRSVVWDTDNSSVVTVDLNGRITAVAPGVATITVAAAEGGLSAQTTVTVVRRVTGITHDAPLTMMAGERAVLTATIEPVDATNRNLTWTSNNTAIATVVPIDTNTATLITHNSGSVIITARASEGSFTFSRTITIEPVPVTGIAMDFAEANVGLSSTLKLNATISPDNATNRGITWTSSHPSVATVDNTGLVRGVSAGETTITARTHDGNHRSTSLITVIRVPVTGVSLSPLALTLLPNETSRLTANISPSNASDTRVTWISSNSQIASVDETGLVRAISPGIVDITATTIEGGFRSISTITVGRRVTGIQISPLTINFGAQVTPAPTATLTATVLPSNAQNTAVTWTSSNPNIATVDSNGRVTRATPGITGTTTITARTQDGGFTATAVVTVIQFPVTGVTIAPAAPPNLNAGATQQLTATIAPLNATNRTLTWTSSNTNVATVSQTGLVTGVTAGTSIITVTTADGGFTASANITVVIIPVASITLAPATVALSVGATSQLTANVLPANATNRNVTWTSSDSAIATVNSTGLVTGIRAGTAIITARTVDGGRTANATINVTFVPVTAVTIMPTTAAIRLGTTLQLHTTLTPPNASNRTLLWSTSDASIATVSDTGLVTPIRVGTVTITVTTVDGARTANSTITITGSPITRLRVSPTTASLNVGATTRLTPIVEPVNASTDTLVWTSSNTAIATVSSTGLVTGVSAGTVTITVRTPDNLRSANSTITITGSPITSLRVSPTTASLNVGATTRLTPIVEPSNVATDTLVWTSSNTAIATVNSTGLVTGVAAGNATITVRTPDNLRSANSTITVTTGALPPGVPSGTVIQNIVPNRSTEVRLEGVARVNLPANAVSGVVSTLTAWPVPTPETNTMLGFASRQAIDPLSGVTMFSVLGGEMIFPANVTLYFDPARLGSGKTPAIFVFNERTNRWIYIGGTRSDRTITAQVQSFSMFAVFGINPLPLMNDISDHWGRTAITTLQGMNVLGGFPDGTFRPNASVTRAEFASMISRALMLSQNPQAADRFTDLGGMEWAKGGIGAAVSANLMGGFPDNTFGAQRGITRAEIAVILSRIVQRNHVRIQNVQAPRRFIDTIPDWAIAGVQHTTSAGLMGGFPDNTFRPSVIATRAQVASMIYRLIAE